MKLSFGSSSYAKACTLIAGVVAFAGLGSVAHAQTVTVNPTGTANGTTIFTNLQDAVSSFAVGGSNAANPDPNVINVLSTNGPITGNVLAVAPDPSDSAPVTSVIDQDILIQGVDEQGNDSMVVFIGTPLTAAQQTLRGGTFPAIAWRQAVDLTVRNLAFIPYDPQGGQRLQSFMVVRAPGVAGVHVSVSVENCVFTANDGSNQPLTTTGVAADDAKLNNPGVIAMPSGSAGIWAFSRGERGDMELNVTNSVFASIATLSGANPRFEAIKAWMSGGGTDFINCIVNVNEGCVFANLDGNVAQISWSAMIRMNGTEENPIIIRNLKNPGSPAVIWMYYDPAFNQPVAGEFNWVRIYDCVTPAISEGGVLGDGSRAWINHFTNSIIADTGDGLALRSLATNLDSTGLATPAITVDNVVMHNAGTGTNAAGIYGYANATRPVNITNSVFTDNGTKYGLYSTSVGSVWTVSDSILSTQGANPLIAQAGGTGTITLEASVSDEEVVYLNMDDPFSPDFFKVDDTSSVNNWTIY